MVIEWREREHEDVDASVEGDMRSQKALQRCGIYNFWAIKGMRAQAKLLQTLINYWDQEVEAFNLDGKQLRIEVEDIYFITVLSLQGEMVNLKAQGAGGGMTIEDFIST
jgi:hypothetical protein